MSSARGLYTQSEVDLINKLRLIWEQHVMWTRSFIISTAADLGDLEAVTKRLLRNPGDFADVFRQFYGPRNADTLRELFTQHLLIAADLVNAAKRNDAAAASAARQKWYKNAEDIAAFLAKLNPNWSESKWRSLLFDHLKMTEDEAVFRLGKKYQEDVAIYDKIQEEAMLMADYMAIGIIKQFMTRQKG